MDNPRLIPLEVIPNSNSAFVILRGLSSEHKIGIECHQEWVSQLRQSGFAGSIYQYWWDSSPYVHTYFKVKSRAKTVGRHHFAADLMSVKEQQMNILAHSMGCRIPYHMLQLWNERGEYHPVQKRLETCVFLGGHIKRDTSRPWHLFPQYFSSGLFNFYNKKDKTLKKFHKTMGLLDSSPCGRKPIEYQHPQIVNINVESIAKSHSQYISVLSRYLRFRSR